MFTQALIKDLPRIHVHKIFNCRVSFKMLLLMCLTTVDKVSKCPFLTLVLNKKNKNKLTGYYDIFIPFKSWVSSRHGNFIFLLFSIISPKANFFPDNSNLTNLVYVQRLHENGKRNKCDSDRGKYFVSKTLLLFHTALLKSRRS